MLLLVLYAGAICILMSRSHAAEVTDSARSWQPVAL
jgi:hypothetical protein